VLLLYCVTVLLCTATKTVPREERRLISRQDVRIVVQQGAREDQVLQHDAGESVAKARVHLENLRAELKQRGESRQLVRQEEIASTRDARRENGRGSDAS